jgi:hypothetical protein
VAAEAARQPRRQNPGRGSADHRNGSLRATSPPPRPGRGGPGPAGRGRGRRAGQVGGRRVRRPRARGHPQRQLHGRLQARGRGWSSTAPPGPSSRSSPSACASRWPWPGSPWAGRRWWSTRSTAPWSARQHRDPPPRHLGPAPPHRLLSRPAPLKPGRGLV